MCTVEDRKSCSLYGVQYAPVTSRSAGRTYLVYILYDSYMPYRIVASVKPYNTEHFSLYWITALIYPLCCSTLPLTLTCHGLQPYTVLTVSICVQCRRYVIEPMIEQCSLDFGNAMHEATSPDPWHETYRAQVLTSVHAVPWTKTCTIRSTLLVHDT